MSDPFFKHTAAHRRRRLLRSARCAPACGTARIPAGGLPARRLPRTQRGGVVEICPHDLSRGLLPPAGGARPGEPHIPRPSRREQAILHRQHPRQLHGSHAVEPVLAPALNPASTLLDGRMQAKRGAPTLCNQTCQGVIVKSCTSWKFYVAGSSTRGSFNIFPKLVEATTRE